MCKYSLMISRSEPNEQIFSKPAKTTWIGSTVKQAKQNALGYLALMGLKMGHMNDLLMNGTIEFTVFEEIKGWRGSYSDGEPIARYKIIMLDINCVDDMIAST